MKRKAYIEFVALDTVRINTAFIAAKTFKLLPNGGEKRHINLVTLKIGGPIHVLDESCPPFFALSSYNERTDRYSIRIFAREQIDSIREIDKLAKGSKAFSVSLIGD